MTRLFVSPIWHLFAHFPRDFRGKLVKQRLDTDGAATGAGPYMRTSMFQKLLALLMAIFLSGPLLAEPLRLTITDGVIEPLPFALPIFDAEVAGSEAMAQQVSQVISEDLAGTGLFRPLPQSAFISRHVFNTTPAYPDWRAINAQALVTGAVSVTGGQVVVKFRLYDVFTGVEMGDGQQLVASADGNGWRRLAHKVADQVYSRITGEAGYFDSRVIYVAESGPKDNRHKIVSIMDYDGRNAEPLTVGNSIVLAPRFSPSGDRVLYTSISGDTGSRINMLDVSSARPLPLVTAPGNMAFSPRFNRDGTRVIYSLEQGGNTDIWMTDIASGQHMRLTSAPSIETAPSLSPDGSQIVFESDRSGSQQLYIMPVSGGEARRISFGDGRYGTPVWSPRGDMVAFTKQNQGRFHIGVMRTDGSEERLLTSASGGFLDESPTWAPNGRVLMFFREALGPNGGPSLYTVDISGRNLRQVPVSGFASDPSWGPLLR